MNIGFRACRLKTNSQARGRVFSGKILSESFSPFVFPCAIHFNTFLDSEGENYLVMMVMLLLFTPPLRLCFNVRSQNQDQLIRLQGESEEWIGP